MASIMPEFKVSHTEEELSEDKSFFHCNYIRIDMPYFSQLPELENKLSKVGVFVMWGCLADKFFRVFFYCEMIWLL